MLLLQQLCTYHHSTHSHCILWVIVCVNAQANVQQEPACKHQRNTYFMMAYSFPDLTMYRDSQSRIAYAQLYVVWCGLWVVIRCLQLILRPRLMSARRYNVQHQAKCNVGKYEHKICALHSVQTRMFSKEVFIYI